MPLSDPSIKKLTNLIKDSFRVRRNQRPLYVDLGGSLERIAAAQHQVIFGRRGSGKSCLLVHYLNTTADSRILPIYVLADEFKKLTYPDILIRLLVEILESMPVRWAVFKKLLRRPAPTRVAAEELRKLLDVADESEVIEDRQHRTADTAGVNVSAQGVGQAAIGSTTDQAQTRSSRFKERKIDTLERHLRDYKNAIISAVKTSRAERGCVLIDDFYLISREWQADVFDYIHRLLRDSDVYLKVATIRHRTTLLRNRPQTVGVELGQDVEEINLDRTLEDLEATEQYLLQMLRTMGERVGVTDLMAYFNPDALQALTLASGGVPRDFLNIFVNAVEVGVPEERAKWLTPRNIYKGAGRLAYQTKLKNLRDDAGLDAAGLDRVLVDLLTFCLKEKRKTAFLISQDEAQQHPGEHRLIQQLMDFKLIHVVEPDTSAASGRSGRYEAYTLDFSLFMEPRRRSIEIIEFWRRGEDSHRVGIREAPVYGLDRVARVFEEASTGTSPEAFLDEPDVETGAKEQPQARSARELERGVQGNLFDRVNGRGDR
ncbi:MAG: hypothetical protein HY067_14890 [Betaproteobacteria bacterium]|nr:hypothetical protein [Betaproteobacteria bacterium]